MLNKLLDAAKLRRLLQRWRLLHQPPHNHKDKGGSRAGLPLPLKIVLPGGVVELYYMAVPAVRMMEAHPSFMVARPEVFRRPWDSVVHPDEILKPGEKFFLVPRRTVQKLRRRIRKPSANGVGELLVLPSTTNSSFASQTDTDTDTDSPPSSINEANYSTDTETLVREPEHSMRLPMRNNGNGEEDSRNNDRNTKLNIAASQPQPHQRMRRVRSIISWRPSLTAIVE